MAKPEPEKCPKCGAPGPFARAPRLTETKEGPLFELGSRCQKCGAEWGFKKA